MFVSGNAGKHSSLLAPIAFSLLGLIYIGCANAQVMNADFSTPSIANLPPNPPGEVTPQSQGYFPDPTGPGVGWTFDSSSGVQQNGSQLGALPAPLPGIQTGYIQNHGTISQSISFPTSGTYKLSYYLAAGRANGSLQFQVSIDGTLKESIKGASTAFTLIPITFSVTQGSHTLSFAGAGQLNASVDQIFFIDQVSITLVPSPPPLPGGTGPQITSGVPVISHTQPIMLEGQNFGPPYGKFHIHFPKPATSPFPPYPPYNNYTDLSVDADRTQWFGSGANIIGSLPITTASQTGSVTQQTVDITMTTKDGKTSNVWHATFIEDAWITGGSQTVSPNVAFYLAGWNFGSPGTITIHFPTRNPTDPSSFDVIAATSLVEWSPFGITAMMPNVQGVVEQTVDITFKTQNGRKSNTWKAKFIPTMDIEQLTYEDFTVVSCSDQGQSNICDGVNSVITGSSCFFGPNPEMGVLMGSHVGCWGGDSDDGTDNYSVASLKNGSIFNEFDFYPQTPSDPAWVDNGTVGYEAPLLGPSSIQQISVPWHIGATGGYVYYNLDITIKGPKGVPYY
jgi:hypothetical protein